MRSADQAEFMRSIAENFPSAEVLAPWDRQDTVEMMLGHGPEQLFRSGIDIRSYGAFYVLYGKIVDRLAKVDDIEKHFENRLRASITPEQRIAAVGLEARLFADAARNSEQPYIALQALLAAIRGVAFEIQNLGMMTAQLEALLRAAYAEALNQAWIVSDVIVGQAEAAGGLVNASGGAALFVTYPVLCCNAMDALVLRSALEGPDDARASVSKLAKFVTSEPGCAHPISDRYAVSIAWAIRTLWSFDYVVEARALLKECTIWLIDRYWDSNSGLAACDAAEDEEIAQLLGGPFSGLEVVRDGS